MKFYKQKRPTSVINLFLNQTTSEDPVFFMLEHFHIYKQNLALNDPQGLISHKI